MANTRSNRQTRNRTRKMDLLKHPFVRQSTGYLKEKYLQKGIRRPVKWKYVQEGAGVEKSIVVSGYKILYEDNTDDEFDNSVLCIARDGGICFRIDFSLDDKAITITTMSFYPTCFSDFDIQEEGAGIKLIFAAMIDIILSNKHIDRYDRILMTDSSSRLVPTLDGKKKIKVELMDMYYMCTGCTWYGSLVPMFIQEVNNELAFLNLRQNIVGPVAITFKTLMERLFEDHYTDAYKTISSIAEKLDILINSELPASKILETIRAKLIYSEIFTKYRASLLIAFKVLSLNGSNWCIALENGKLLAPETPLCIHRDGYSLKKYIKVIADSEFEAEKKKRQVDGIVSEQPKTIVKVERYE